MFFVFLLLFCLIFVLFLFALFLFFAKELKPNWACKSWVWQLWQRQKHTSLTSCNNRNHQESVTHLELFTITSVCWVINAWTKIRIIYKVQLFKIYNAVIDLMGCGIQCFYVLSGGGWMIMNDAAKKKKLIKNKKRLIYLHFIHIFFLWER